MEEAMGLEPIDVDPSLLARKHAEGLWTLEQLDQAPADWPTDRPYYNLAREWTGSTPMKRNGRASLMRLHHPNESKPNPHLATTSND